MIRRKQSGQVMVSAALMLVVLLGFAGLGIDMGVLRYEKRLQQTAADGAAIAAATNLAPYTGYQTGALNAAAASVIARSTTTEARECGVLKTSSSRPSPSSADQRATWAIANPANKSWANVSQKYPRNDV